MKRLFSTLILIAASALVLSACTTSPAKPEPAPAVTKTTTDLMLEVRKAELELERIDLMARLKFAVESGSEFVKGYVMGQAGSSAKAAPSGGSTSQMVLQAQAQADAVALRREEMAERNSGFNKSLQVLDRVVPVYMFSQGLKFQKWQIGETNSQNRYTLNTVRGAQADGFAAGSGATLNGVTAGHSTTLGGISAGANAAATGARAVQSPADDATTETPAE